MKCWSLYLLSITTIPLIGCGGGSASTDFTPGTDVDQDTGTPTDTVPSGDLWVDETPPEVSQLLVEASPHNVLSYTIRFQTSEAAIWKLRVKQVETGHGWEVTPSLSYSQEHLIPVIGLEASHQYQVEIEVADGVGNSKTLEPLALSTQALPGDLPPMRFLGSQPERMEPGFTLFNVLDWADIQGSGLLLAVDAEGTVVWYHRTDSPLVESLKTSQGTILAIIGECDGIIELDMQGNLLQWWKPAELGLDSLHHTLGLASNGNLLSLATELRSIDGYPKQSGGTVTYQVVGEIAVEFTRSRQLVHAWPLLDVLDPYHYTDGFFLPFWIPLYPDASGGPKDWGHGNGILELPGDDDYLVSLPNQELVVRLDRGTGQPVWKAGPSGNVILEAGGEWYSNQHGVDFTADGRMLVYDDGTYKATDIPRSRLAEYQFTAPASEGDPWSARQIWSWDGGASPFYSYSPADVDYLPNGNLLVVHGSLVGHPELSRFSSSNTLSVRIQELDRSSQVEVVFAMEVGGPWDATGKRLSSFAAVRLSTLYPEAWHVLELAPNCDATCGEGICGTVGGCDCGHCSFGTACLNAHCVTCDEGCLGRVCGDIELQCECGTCPTDQMCDAEGQCVESDTFCIPFCLGMECGLVGAIYMGQTCNCGDCPEGSKCDYNSFTCVPIS